MPKESLSANLGSKCLIPDRVTPFTYDHPKIHNEAKRIKHLRDYLSNIPVLSPDRLVENTQLNNQDKPSAR